MQEPMHSTILPLLLMKCPMAQAIPHRIRSAISIWNMKQYWTSDDYLTHFTKMITVFMVQKTRFWYIKTINSPSIFDTGCGFTEMPRSQKSIFIFSKCTKQTRCYLHKLFKITNIQRNGFIKESIIPMLIFQREATDDVRVQNETIAGYITK